MRQLALLLPAAFLMASCSSFVWEGRGKGVTEQQMRDGIPDITKMSDDYNDRAYWRSVRRRKDGRTNAFGRDLDKITDFIDRHLFNYSKHDPSVNFPTDSTMLDHSFQFMVDSVAGRLPIIDDSTR